MSGRASTIKTVDVISSFGALHRGWREDAHPPSGVIQRTVGATLYLDGGGAGAGAVSSGVHAPAPRWDSAPLAKIHNPAASTHRPGRVQQCRHAAELYDGLDAAAQPRCADSVVPFSRTRPKASPVAT
jgi:hypothetical protein